MRFFAFFSIALSSVQKYAFIVDRRKASVDFVTNVIKNMEIYHRTQISVVIASLDIKEYLIISETFGVKYLHKVTDTPSSHVDGQIIYILDSGIYRNHEEFEGRAVWGHTFVGNHNDLFGHGTFVGAVAAGKTYGIAKNAKIISVKLGDKAPESKNLADAILWAALDSVRKRKTKSIINISLSLQNTPKNIAAINFALECNVFIVLSAGNDAYKFCKNYNTIVVGSSSKDSVSHFSNVGCITVFAPGEDVESATINTPSSSGKKSGTSISAPYISGILTLWFQKYPDMEPTILDIKKFLYFNSNSVLVQKMSFKTISYDDVVLFEHKFD